MAVMVVKILITTIQVNFVPRPSGTKFTLIVVIKFFTINLPSQPFLGHHLGFHIFFHHSLSEGRTLFFTAWLFWIRFHFFLYLYTPKPAISSFSLPQDEEKMKQRDFFIAELSTR